MSDIAVGVNTLSGWKLVSYFDVITDSIFQNYQARGVSSVDASSSVYVAGITSGALHGQTSSGDGDAFLIKFVQIVKGVEVSTAWIILAVLIAIAAASFALYRRRHKARVRRRRHRHHSHVVSLGLRPDIKVSRSLNS